MLRSALLTLSLAACTGKDDDEFVTVSETDADADADTDTDADSDADTDSDPDYFEPAAVGFELYGGWNAQTNELVDYSYDGGETMYVTYVLLTFATTDFFSESDPDRQDAEDCVVGATFTYTPAKIEATSYEDGFSLASWAGWEGRLDFTQDYFETDDAEGNCTNWDPDLFPGGDPVETFSGMHFGVGFGDVTDYLLSAWSDTAVEDYGDYMFTQFIAVNHPTGDGYDFKGYDWTTGLLWEMDLDTGAVSSDEKGYLIPTADFDTGGYVTGNAYWFEDFPNLDYSLLKEGAPEM